MEDRAQDILGHYGFMVNSMKRVRGAQLLSTDEGILLLLSTSCRNRRLAMENRVKEYLKGQGYALTDIYVKNMEGEYLTTDRYGNGFVVKHWFLGEEVSLKDTQQIAAAAGNLGRLHRLMRGIFWEKDMPISMPGSSENLICQMERHNQELKRVYTYILGKNQKNEFETLYLSLYNDVRRQAGEALELLKASAYEDMLNAAVENGEILHGSYNQHKVLLLENNEIATIDFSKAEAGLQILDFYHFLRKTLEKNEWDGEYVRVVRDAYLCEREISQDEWDILYALFLYPEKFWKAANYYNNSRKSWVSSRTCQKLLDVKDQMEVRQEFLLKFKGAFKKG